MAGDTRKAGGRPEQVGAKRLREVALRVADRVGAGSLSIRGVARELGVTPMALYRHVASLEALQDMVVDEALCGLREPENGAWRDRVLEMMIRTRRALLDHPGAAGVVNMRAIPVAEVVRLSDWYIATLEEGGFEGEAVVEAFDALSVFVQGSVLHELTRESTARMALLERSETATKGRLARYRRHLASRDGERYFRRGAEALLDGLERLPRSPK